MHLTEKFEYNASEGVKGMDIEKITGELEKSGEAEKLRELAGIDAAAIAAAAKELMA